ncbi:MAG: amidohydrolase [Cenarchaeum symbiont of Oopsacas minuta]|nr:amidohydrolase [Cenarchaeum symbiont of Oopsacas minuta]
MSKVAIVQFKASTDKNDNLKRIIRYVERASKRGADLVAFPEFMMFYTPISQTASELESKAESVRGSFVTTVAKAARDNSIQVVGTFYEKTQDRKNRVYDTSFLFSKTGKMISKYRKVHLYDALGFSESAKIAAGSSVIKPVKSILGKTGMMICYDLRFPEMARALAASGSQVMIVPSAWVKGNMKEEHWIIINRARAIENGCYVISPNHVGNIYCGRSLVVDPFGKILLDMKKCQGMNIVEISMKRVKEIRKVMPLLKNRRTDLYPDIRI